MGVSRAVQVRVKHIVGSDVRWLRNERVTYYRFWTKAAARPASDDDEQAEGTITCGDCAVVINYRLLTVDRTRRRRRISGTVALINLALLPVTIALIVNGTLGHYDIIALLVVAGSAPVLLVVYLGEKNGIRVAKNATGPDGRRPASRHEVDVVHTNDRPLP
jgi:hypothetical protein